MSKFHKALLISALVAVLTPLASGGLLAGASALADGSDTGAVLEKTIAPKPVASPSPHRRTLSTLGRARAVAWIRIGHVGH